jgi:mannose-1-phosphate guanylyltransferase/mannose-1-phosphate guanylyltransferase/mannose-6-phosphate isomerase
MFNDCLIMAGGSGTRLWPASNSRLPKQFLPATEKMSFFSLALERAFALGERVIIITGESHVPHVISEAAKFSAAEKKRMVVIGEPVAKNTAPAIACAVVYSLFGGSGRNMLVLTSDHIIKPLETFKKNALLASISAGEGNLVIFGIPPSHPETGYGYIEAGKQTKDGVFSVTAFREKPDLQTAKKYVASKRFFWNSGMFAFNSDFMAEQFRSCQPDVYQCFEKLKQPKSADYAISKGVKVLTGWKGLESAYTKTKSISFDYAIAEKCSKTAMIRTNFDWIDIGNWEEYIKIGKPSKDIFSVESDTCYVDSEIPVALAGVEDLIVVIRGGKNACALITRKGQTQKVRDVVEKIKNTGRKELL